MIGSSEESNVTGPNQDEGARFAPKKYTSQNAHNSRPSIAELVGMFVAGSTCLNSAGCGPRPRTASAYAPRVAPSISPLSVPRQEMTMNTPSNVPPTFENTWTNASRAPA